MFPNIYKLLNQPTIAAIVGDNIGPFGKISQGTPAPYITFHIISHEPHNHLSGAAISDSYVIQMDFWHNTQTGCMELAKAVRDRLDNQNITNHVIIMAYESETDIYRISLQATIIHQRF